MLSCAGSSRGSRLLPLLLAGLILMAATPSALFAQAVTGTLLGTVTDSTGAVIAGAKVTVTNQNTGFTRTVKTDAIGEYTAPSIPTGTYTVLAEMDGFKTTALSQRRARRRPARAHRRQARSRRDDRVGHHRGADAAGPDLVLRARHDRQGRADPGAAAQRPQLRQPDAHRAGRAARHPRRQHRRRRQPGVARLGVVLGQRAALARQQLHARRRGQQRDVAADRRHLPERRRPRRVQAADQHLLGRVRPVARRRRQPADQVGHEQLSRQRLRVPPQRRARRQQLLQQPRRPREARFQAEPVRRHVRRSDLQGPDVLLRRLPGPPREAGTDVPVDRSVHADAAGELLGVEPRHLRPDDRTAVPGQHHPEDRWDPASSNILRAALSGAEHRGHDRRGRPAGQQLPDQPGQGAAGQPVRRQGRPQPHRPTTASSRATAIRRRIGCSRPRCRTAMPARPSAPATATSRRRAWRSTTRTRSAATG